MAWEKNGTPDTLTGAGDDIDITDLTAKKFNQFLSHELASGNTAGDRTFNNNSNAVYAMRKSTNGATDITLIDKAFHELNTNLAFFGDWFIIDYTFSISGEEQLTIIHLVNRATAGTGVAPERVEFVGKFVPSPDAGITRIDIHNVASGSFGTDSNLSAVIE